MSLYYMPRFYSFRKLKLLLLNGILITYIRTDFTLSLNHLRQVLDLEKF